MNFQNDQVVFFDRYAQHIYYPLGPTTRSEVNGQIVVNPRPMVQFHNHQLTLTDEEIIEAMIRDERHFEMPSGFYLAAESLPKDLQQIYPTLYRKNKRNVALALLKGASSEDAKKCILVNLEAKPSSDSSNPPATNQRCPFCKLSFQGAKDVHATLLVHVQTQHQSDCQANPSWRDLIAG